MASQVSHINQLSQINPEFLKNAEFIQYGKTLFIKLPNEKLLVIKDYFANATDSAEKSELPAVIESGHPPAATNALGLPEDLIYNSQIYNSEAFSDNLLVNNITAAASLFNFTPDKLIFMDTGEFKEFALANDLTDTLSDLDGLILTQFESAIADTVSGEAEISGLSFLDTELLAEILNISDDLQSFEQELTVASIGPISGRRTDNTDSYTRADLSSDSFNADSGTDSAELYAPPGDSYSGELAGDPPQPPVVAPVNVDRMADSLGTLNANLNSLNSANIEQGTLLPTSDVDGINGLGGDNGGLGPLGSGFSSDSINGALGSDTPQSLAPPADAFAGSPVLPEIIPHTINFDGQLNLSYKDIQWDVLTHLNDANIAGGQKFGDGQGKILFNATSADTPLNGDLLVFSDASDFLHSYSQFGLSTSGGSSVTFSYAKLFDFTDITAATTFTLNYTLAGAQSISFELNEPIITGQDVVDQINYHLGVTALANDATLSGADAFSRSADGFKAVSGMVSPLVSPIMIMSPLPVLHWRVPAALRRMAAIATFHRYLSLTAMDPAFCPEVIQTILSQVICALPSIILFIIPTCPATKLLAPVLQMNNLQSAAPITPILSALIPGNMMLTP